MFSFFSAFFLWPQYSFLMLKCELFVDVYFFAFVFFNGTELWKLLHAFKQNSLGGTLPLQYQRKRNRKT